MNDDPTSHNIHPTPANNREWNKAEPPGTKLEEALARLRTTRRIAVLHYAPMRGTVVGEPPVIETLAQAGYRIPA